MFLILFLDQKMRREVANLNLRNLKFGAAFWVNDPIRHFSNNIMIE